MTRSLPRLATAVAVLLMSGVAEAARARFHFVPDAAGHLHFAPDPGPKPQDRSGWPGSRAARTTPPRPNVLVSFRHPATGRLVRVPLQLAEGTPRMEYRADRVIYNYGSDTIEVRFLADGSVDVIYNSGFLRDL